LVDTSIWVDHMRFGEAVLAEALRGGDVLVHPHVIGELALGNLNPRLDLLRMLGKLPRASVATDGEVHHLIETTGLSGLGIGYVDAHLLAAVRLTRGSRLWTRDKKLIRAAAKADVVIVQPH
jgi:predicted nucleic acid-binding protein